MQPLSGNQRPDLLTALMNMSLVLRPLRKMHLCRSSSNVPRLPSFLETLQNPHVLLTCDKVHNPLRLPSETTSERPKVVRTPSVFNIFDFRNVLHATTACTFSTSQLPKVLRTWGGFSFFTCKRASRHNSVHFFDISASKSGPELVCFVHFDLEVCFAPQRRALFRHRNFYKRSEADVLCTFWLGHVLRVTTACNFSSLIWPGWLRTRRFSEPTFRPSGATNHWKNTVFRDFPTFSRTWIFFLLRLSLLWSSLFFSSLLYSSAPPLLFICPYCRKFDF